MRVSKHGAAPSFETHRLRDAPQDEAERSSDSLPRGGNPLKIKHKKKFPQTYPRALPRAYPVRIPPLTEGVSDQHLQMRGGERWPGNDLVSEMRRHGPAVEAAARPGAPAARHGAPLTVAARHGQKCWAPFGPRAVDRRPRNSQGEQGLPERVSPPGALRSRPTKHRARDAIGLGGLAALPVSTSLDVARRRGPRVRAFLFAHLRELGCAGTLGVPRALGFFAGASGKGDGPPRGQPKNTGDDACAFYPPLEGEGRERSERGGVNF